MQMQKVENGKFVSVSYTGTLENGEVFDTSEGRRPLEFQTGAGQLIK
jgi:peptidylprolyl isomerase